MYEPHEATHDDARNLSTIAVSALLGIVATASLFALASGSGPVEDVKVLPFEPGRWCMARN